MTDVIDGRTETANGAEVVVLSEYGLTNVSRPVHLNRALRQHGLVVVREEMGGELLKNVVRTEAAPISLALEFRDEHPSGGKLQAGELASIVARSLTPKDTLCGHEQTYYPPLTPTKHAMPVAASLDQFSGDGLGVKWTLREKRSAFVGHFAR